MRLVTRAVAVVVLALSQLLGCGTHLGSKQRAAIPPISIDPRVEAPELQTSDTDPFVLYALAGGAPMKISADEATARLRAAVQANGIDLPRIAYETFRDRLAATRAFTIVEPAGDVQRLKLKIFSLELGRNAGLGDDLHPVVVVGGQMEAADGTLLWRQATYVNPANSHTPSFPFADYVDHPDDITVAFTRAFEVIADVLVRDLTAP